MPAEKSCLREPHALQVVRPSSRITIKELSQLVHWLQAANAGFLEMLGRELVHNPLGHFPTRKQILEHLLELAQRHAT